jgi:four helix bundle protein
MYTKNIKSYEDLLVWQKSMVLVKEIYILTKNFPKDEMFGLTSQIKRAAVSIPSNIAEGYLRISRKEYIRFLHMAYGSAAEVQTQIKIVEMLSFCDKEKTQIILLKVKEVLMMLNGLLGSLKKY